MSTLLKTLAILLIVTSVFAVDRRRHTRHHLRSKTRNDKFIIIFDAGSSKTAIQLNNGLTPVPNCEVKNTDQKLANVISLPPTDPKVTAYVDALGKLIEDLAKISGCENTNNFEGVWLQSTAGSRNSIVDSGSETGLAAIQSGLDTWLTSKATTYTKYKAGSFIAEVISGRYEGIYGWIAASLTINDLTGSGITNNKQYVYVEVGGASLQVAFDNTDCQVSSGRRFSKKSTRGDVVFAKLGLNLYSQSWLGLGANDLVDQADGLQSNCVGVNEASSSTPKEFNAVGTAASPDRNVKCKADIDKVLTTKTDKGGKTFAETLGWAAKALEACQNSASNKKDVFLWNGITYFGAIETWAKTNGTPEQKETLKKKWADYSWLNDQAKSELCQLTNFKSCLGAVYPGAFTEALQKTVTNKISKIVVIKITWVPGSIQVWLNNDGKTAGIDQFKHTATEKFNEYEAKKFAPTRRNRRNRH